MGRSRAGNRPAGATPDGRKSRVCHLDEGFDFLGFRIQRRRKKGTAKMNVYTYPSKKALASIVAKVRGTISARQCRYIRAGTRRIRN